MKALKGRCMDEKKFKTLPVPLIDGKRIYLRGIRPQDAEGDYCRWMNDNEVTRYLESRFTPHSVQSIASFITQVNESSDSVLFAIVVRDGNTHIGNIKIGSINWIHHYADVGLLIGSKAHWGKGFATEALNLVVEYAFRELNLHRLEAGCYSNNIGSIKAFKKAGFIEEGIMEERYLCEGEYVDRACLGLVNKR